MQTTYEDRPQTFSFEKLFDTSHISHKTFQHLKNVYSCLTATILSAALGCALSIYLSINLSMTSSWLLIDIVASLGILFYIRSTSSPRSEVQLNRFLALVAFGGLNGVSLTPLVSSVIQINPSIIVTALLATTTIFACFTLAALTQKSRSYMYMTGLLLSAFGVISLVSLMNLFIRSSAMEMLTIYGSLIIFSLFIVCDTQIIIAKAEEYSHYDSVEQSITLFLDLINIFQHLLIILGNNEQQEKKRNRKNE
ncbi:hypothetical protein SNEBB_009704 [Seison nebaliae]|nr:hypothetical protein SNEBB_009704 [Seison nebaliae]